MINALVLQLGITPNVMLTGCQSLVEWCCAGLKDVTAQQAASKCVKAAESDLASSTSSTHTAFAVCASSVLMSNSLSASTFCKSEWLSSAQCITSIRQIIKSLCLSVSVSLSLKRVERSTGRNFSPNTMMVSIEVDQKTTHALSMAQWSLTLVDLESY